MEDKLIVFNYNKKNAEKFIIFGGILVAVGAIMILLGSETNSGIFTIGFIVAIPGLILAMIGLTKFNSLKKTFKDQVLSKMFQEIIPGISYQPSYGLPPTEVYMTHFLKQADRFHSEDFLAGQIDGVEFISSDVKLEERHVQHTKNGTRVYYVAYFIGRVFKFSFNKDFVGTLIVTESGSPTRGRGYNKVKLESIDFNKKFKTYTTEDITAFYILTPDIIEALYKLEKRHPGRIGISFIGDNMYVAINNNKDTFELQMFRKIDQSMILEFEQDLLVIKDFIMSLKLNNNLFKK